MNGMISGAIAMASLVIALFFLRFWRSSRDRFFLYFALSFLVQAGHRVYAAFPVIAGIDENNPLHYSFRLLAYALILWAVLEKNWPRRKRPGDTP
ncbi:DUF5985 family protein [Massilia sp. DJPM01]|uniref:DUF5985 family protein n=1 Tax=Massilia sp. DJPM01 TaxID=3024404 RepID=UPI00259DDFC6|nr:DUF5985 family protein [Massilia sp. DJPM01]MDM5177141.1 DUF5985 family protein [Massilia sp. DJPM01]